MATTSASEGRPSLLSSALISLAAIAFRVAILGSGLVIGYLLFGILFQLHGFPGLSHADRVRVIANIDLATTLLVYSIAVASLTGAIGFFDEELTGYIMVLVGALLYLGIPYALLFALGNEAFSANWAMAHAVAAFPQAIRGPFPGAPFVAGPFMFGGLLIARDICLRLIDAIQNKQLKREQLQYGGEAKPEAATPDRPRRLSPLGKCWEGPFCRDFIRPHCPIFQARKACWRVKRGCYCEEEIVSSAAGKVSGVQLSMAPDPRYNFANAPTALPVKPVLSPAQKRERCRHCVIYSEHQRQKYNILMPIMLIGVVGLCIYLAPFLQSYLGMGLMGIDALMHRFTFGDAAHTRSWSFTHPSPTVEWVFIGAFIIMIVSKALQALEWVIFKIQI